MGKGTKKIAFVGGGNMAEAIFSGLLKKGTVTAEDIFVTEKRLDRRNQLEQTYGIETAEDNSLAPTKASTILLAVKPQVLPEVQEEIKTSFTSEHLLISILAGISRQRLSQAFGFPERVVRVMPNLPALLGCGISAITFPDNLSENERDWVRSILRSVGDIVEVEETQQDVVTAVSGSGPGYMFYFAQHFIAAAVAQGLDETVAQKLVTETFAGTAELLRQREESPAELVQKVATPGGTTEAGLSALKELNLPGMIEETVRRAVNRAQELNKK